MKVAEKHREKTAFTVGNGLWQSNVMAFDLYNAPAMRHIRLMVTILGDLRSSIYLDALMSRIDLCYGIYKVNYFS